MSTFHSIVSRCTPLVKPTSTLALGIAVCATAVSAAVADKPDVIYLDGTVRDFLKNHPDFNIASGTGHVANNVTLMSAQNRPHFTGAGFEVGMQWRNFSSDEIAPHMFYNGTSIQLANEPDISGNPNNPATFDSWNSNKGTYGGDNAGGDPPPADYDAPMPEVFPPTGLPPALEHGNQQVHHNLNFSGVGSTYTISESFQCAHLDTDREVTLKIAEDSTVVIYATGDFSLGRDSTIHVPESSNLHLYVANGMSIGQNSEINMHEPLNPDRTVITNLGSGMVQFNQDGKVCAHIISPEGKVQLDQNDEFFGTMVAYDLKVSQGGALHWDIVELCDAPFEDDAGSAASEDVGAITSSDTFKEWFVDVLGTNLSYIHTIALVKNANGVYEYIDDAFFPIDDMLFGNEGADHNFNFTYTFKADFVHEQCDDRFFEFEGADDVWVYIDDQLVMDLGGVMAGQRQIIEMDRLGLEDGETYTLHFYYAQRNPYTSVFKVRTDVPLESHPPSGVTLQYD